MIQRIVRNVPKEQLEEDLKKYRQMAIDLGATDAKIISGDDVFVDERARIKCVTCSTYGKCGMCPPHIGTVEETRSLVRRYKTAIFVIWKFLSKDIATNEEGKILLDGWPLLNVMGKIESAAFYDGYYFAHGFGAGSCKLHLCKGADCIHPLIEPGGTCRFAKKARPSMEAVGLDAFGMGANVGWEVYPIGENCAPGQVPSGCRMILVLIH